nr:MAG: hypothetical protein E4H34_05040 [Hyphomicrobiales bacterium]
MMARILPKLRIARAALSLLLVFSLAGCFVSKEPLITPETADYPIASATNFDAFGRRGTDWRPLPEGRSVYRKGNYYYYVNDDSDRKSVPFLLKKISDGRYIAQANDTSNFDRVAEYYYFLIDFDGSEAIQHSGSCWPRQAWIDDGLITQVERTSMNTRCLVENIEDLAVVLEGTMGFRAPEARFVVSAADE